MGRNDTGAATDKLARLHASLRRLGRVAVAYSGGVDSTLLLHAAVQALGPERVAAIHAVSCLVGSRQRQQALALVRRWFPAGVELRPIVVEPLAWDEFVANTDRRCYFCKLRLYRHFVAAFSTGPERHLVDGTNADDVLAHRPGLQAIRELQVLTPLLDAGLTKSEIRSLARLAGLPNHDLPANSCLATRIATGRRIEAGLLRQIDQAEEILHLSGFPGARFRLGERGIALEIRHEDGERFRREGVSEAFHHYVAGLGTDLHCINISYR